MTNPGIHGKYRTRQYDDLVTYLRTIPGRHFTVNDIHAHFLSLGKNIGTATLYRHLDRLVGEGLVNKYILSPGSPACFEYIGTPAPGASASECSYHCLCEVCGRLIHIQCGEIAGLREHLMKEHSFRVDPLRTVFYGVCGDCLRKMTAADTEELSPTDRTPGECSAVSSGTASQSGTASPSGCTSSSGNASLSSTASPSGSASPSGTGKEI